MPSRAAAYAARPANWLRTSLTRDSQAETLVAAAQRQVLHQANASMTI
jgi:hypothetical protein